MRDVRLELGIGVLVAAAATALLAPWLGLRDPTAQPDGLVLRELPPLSRVEEIRLSSGESLLASRVRVLADGSVECRRGDRWVDVAAAELAGNSPAKWHRHRTYLLGTDGFGRDLLSRLVYGARISLGVGLLAALLAVALGALVGCTAGLAGGWTDALLMRFADVTLSVPRIFLILLLVNLYRPSLVTTVLVLSLTSWMPAARLARGEILSLRERDYVQAARVAGASSLRITFLHLLPGAAAPLLVEGALRVGNTILIEASLSFLGLGVPPPTPTWGGLIAHGRDRLLDAWWIATLPGLAIAVTVIAASLLGEALRDRLSPTPAALPPAAPPA